MSLWHACQLRDFESYLKLGGIPSRNLLEKAGQGFTPFATDATDRSKGVWSKVFVNLNDFGSSFAHGHAATPNPYGPVVLQIRPGALSRAADVAIALRSAGAADFDREGESLETQEDVDRLFLYPASAPFPHRSWIRFKDLLRANFAPRYPDAVSAEVSLTIEPELVTMDDVIVIWVDPLEVGGTRLVEKVAELASRAGWSGPVHQRYMQEERVRVMRDLAKYVADRSLPPRLRLLAGRADMAPETREWAVSVLGNDLDWLFQRYAKYLLDGTLDAASFGSELGSEEEGRTSRSRVADQ